MGFVIFDAATLKGYKKNGPDVVSFVHNPDNLDHFDEVVEHAVANNNTDLFYADTLEEIADWCGIEDVDTFLDTVDEYNDMCDSVDTEFFKPRQYMKPIVKAPFLCGPYPSGCIRHSWRC